MDAVDLNWCLSCGCRIELEGSPYCSQSCMNSDKPSTSTIPSYPTVSSFADRDSILDDDDSYFDHSSQDLSLASPSHNTWIGRGDAGIRAWAQSIPRGAPSDYEDSPSTTLKPKLLLDSRRAKPSLCMSRAQPAPPEPSRPILTPQQSLPSLSRDSTSFPSASVLSLTTGSSYSIRTPATASEVGSLHEPPARSVAHHTNFLGGLKAQLRAWATSSTPQKEVRSTTVTRAHLVRVAADDSDAESTFGDSKVRRPRSPAPFFVMPEQYSSKRKELTAKQDSSAKRTSAEDHPAYRARGRKVSRVAS